MSCKLIFSSLTDYVKELLEEVMKCRHENKQSPKHWQQEEKEYKDH